MDTNPTASNNKKFLGLIVLVVILVAVALVVNQKGKILPQSVEQAELVPQELQRTEFGTSMPTDFPADIPVEKDAKVDQSYRLSYTGQMQLAFAFESAKTAIENYDLYADFLKKQNWNVSNKYESATVSSLYGTKEANDINVTMSENAGAVGVKSQVSISVLKK